MVDLGVLSNEGSCSLAAERKELSKCWLKKTSAIEKKEIGIEA
jgi:hypothetical protein